MQVDPQTGTPVGCSTLTATKSMRRKFSPSSDYSDYPSSLTSYDSEYLSTLSTPHVCFLITLGSSSSPRSSPYRPRDHLESLFRRHGYPTPVSLSSLRDLTATSSSYSPPSPPRRFRSDSPPSDALESLSLSSTRPIPIPRRPGPIDIDGLPVTPLTGRFDKDDYLEDWERVSLSARSQHLLSSRPSRRDRYSNMRSDHSPFYSPVASPVMSPRRSTSPQAPRSRAQNSAKSVPGFHLDSLPRFHPAVYQSSSTAHGVGSQPPSSPRSSRQHTYRTTAGSREGKWAYPDFLESSHHQNPSAPRLDPLRSPGPVTPLALESGDYLTAGSSKPNDRSARDNPSQHSGPAPDLVERLIARENEKARQKSRKPTKGR